MRIHHLSVTAFGPFADRVDVDLDALSSGGLFLIHGPTGAGKTSLLDAICFALFANVPGARARAKKSLRSDHAPRDRTPEVTLEFTANGERLRITRSPEYDRPKKRGTGEVSVPARVSLEALHDSAWQVLSTRADEVGEKVNDLIGMGLAQFAKVAVLPQGDFAAFLRSSAEDRRTVLEKLFDITTYADVETWLADERRRTAADAAALRSEVDSQISRVRDVVSQGGWRDLDAGHASAAEASEADSDNSDAAPSPSTEASAEAVGVDTLSPDLPERLAAVQASAEVAVIELLAAADAATLADDEATSRLTAARARAGHRDRGERATAALALLAEQQAAHLARQDAIEASTRAAALDGHLAARGRAVADVAAAARAREDLATDLARTGLTNGVDRAPEFLERLRAGDESGRALEAARRQRSALTTRLQRVVADSDESTKQVARVTDAHELSQADHERVAQDVAAAELVDHDVAAAGRVVDGVTALMALASAIAADRTTLTGLEDKRRSAHDLANTARSRHLDLRERYLGGIAAELAQDLRDGESCSVCGSTEHPAPARASDRVALADVDAAERASSAAAEAHLAASLLVERVSARIEEKTVQLGEVDVLDLDQQLVASRSALEAARAQTLRLADLRTRLAASGRTLETTRTAVERATSRRDAVMLLLSEVTTDLERLDITVTDLEAEHASCPCVQGRPFADWSIHSHDDLADLLERVGAATAAVTTAELALVRADAALAEALRDSRFDSIDAVEAARLTPQELASARGAVADHERALTTAQATLDDEDVIAALAAPVDDVDALAAGAETARHALLRVTREHSNAQARQAELARLIPPLLADLTRLARALATADRVRGLADVVGGLGHNNALRMRLTSYVLAARLESVVDFANERLTTLDGGRYLLEHTDEKVGGARSGLGLRVLDQWTGQFRDPASLSGGETFMASLSLALGLADAVRADSGGYDLGTLFIDEGFGSLDDESLEEVMAVLDGLQSGGRSVGIVSHVADLRTRIPRQLVVHKTPDGSRVTAEFGDQSDQVDTTTGLGPSGTAIAS